MELAALLLAVAGSSISTVSAVYMMILKLHVKIDDKTGDLKTTLVENKGKLDILEMRISKIETANKHEREELSDLQLAIARMPSCGAARRERTRRTDPPRTEG